jgi:chemotaxis protein CheX
MQFAADEIVQLTQDIFSTMLQLEITVAKAGVSRTDEARLTGCVQIAGQWKGAVIFDTPVEFARTAASIMFDMPAANAQAADLQDALAELSNMVGGNLKTLLPAPSFLSLPTVTEGKDYSLSVPGSGMVSCVRLDCQGQLIEVALLEELPITTRAACCATGLASTAS